MKTQTLLFLLVYLLFISLAGTAQNEGSTAPSVSIENLTWLSGDWVMVAGPATIEEHWTRPAGGTVIGMGRTTAHGKTVSFDFFRIEKRATGVFYVAQPAGRVGTDFKLVRSSDSELVFENLEHDFPQRIIYRRNADATLFARIEGSMNGKERSEDFPYQRAKQ